ncbi:MAG: hypothetical protein ACJ72W_05315 [Actinoallomurus sp.]
MLDQIVIDEAVQALRPDFAVLLMTAEGLTNGPSDGRTGEPTPTGGVDGGHMQAWHEAYRGFGVNPKRARPSVDALERLEPYPMDRLVAAGEALAGTLAEISPGVVIRTRLLEP